MEGDLHVSAQKSEESRHSCGLDLTVSSSVEVGPCLIKVLGKVLVSGFSLESEMGINDLISGHFSVSLLENEVSGWLSFWGSELNGVFGDHGVHELVITGSWSREVSWHFSVVVSETFISLVIIMVSLISWMRIFLVPLGGNTWILSKIEFLI